MNTTLPRYDWHRTYDENFDDLPDPVQVEVPPIPGKWQFCGLSVDSPLGIPAGPLLNGGWILYYASLGFDVLTYKTTRSVPRACYDLPNLQPVRCGQLEGGEGPLPATDEMKGSWAVSFGMPSKSPEHWRADVQRTRQLLPRNKILVVSVVATVQPDWTLDDLAQDYAQCARWAIESGADAVETNFSCPNVSTCDGQLYQEPDSMRLVTRRVRDAIGDVPYIIKIGHVNSIDAAAELLDAVADQVHALAMTNSIATTIRSADGTLLFDGQPRGICGAATRAASIEQVARFSALIRDRKLPLSLIGVGGASTYEHVRDYLNAGAESVHLATAAMVDPRVAIKIRGDWKGLE